MAHKTCKDKTKSKPHTENSVPSFIRKTYDILEESRFPDIIDWNPEGTALVIKKPAEFCQKVLPAYFKHNNLTSFVRQLNMYNFHKRRTQNIDHVYSHELFQRGKKHLLKDIKRKNHDHSNDKTPKSTEGNEPSKKDIASLAYENQMLKRLYNEAMAKIAALEDQVKEATTQGQSLWSQISQSTGQENSSTPLSIRLDQQANIPQQSQIFQEVSIPPLRLDSECSGILPSNPFVKNPSNLTTTCAPSLKEEVGESTATDGSHNSPSLHTAAETERGVEGNDAGRSLQISQVSQGGQTFQFRNELFISKKETSIGQLFESWSVENAEIMYFADQKLDRPLTNIQAIPHDVLGKRTLDQNADVKGFESEPSKRHELSIFRRKNLISTGTEEKDGMLAVTDDSEANMVVDLMNFSQPFC